MGQVRYVDFHPDEWLAGTVQLTNAERGLYITACALIYKNAGFTTIEELRCSCHEHGQIVNRLLNRLIKLKKLVLKGTRITNKKASKELQKARKRIANSLQNGAQHKKNKGLQNPVGSKPSTINHQKILPLQGENLLLMGGSNEPTTASSPPMGEAVGLRERGEKLIGNRRVVEQQITAIGPEKVTRALDAVERKTPTNPLAYFLACCRGPKVVVLTPPALVDADAEREAARLRILAQMKENSDVIHV